MSEYEKIMIPLFADFTEPKNFTEDSGYVGMYTFDTERLCTDNCIYFMYRSDIHNQATINVARAFLYKGNVTNYTIYIKNIPYVIYRVKIPNNKKNMIDGAFWLTEDEKLKILSFWGLRDKGASFILNETSFNPVNKNVPIPDILPTLKDVRNGIYTKKGELSDNSQATPL